jgi:hypothetical protein
MRAILGAVAATTILMAAVPAFAGTEIVDDDLLSGARRVGSGEFSKTGVSGYSDLDNFSISLAAAAARNLGRRQAGALSRRSA